jgi:uncharacterized membrane protein
MDKLTLTIALGIACVIGCASQKAAPEPQTGPPGVDIEYHDSDEAAASKPNASEAENSDAKSAKSDDASTTKSDAESKPEPVKKSCTGLKKKDCEVTMGCAWSTDKVCVNH